MIDPLYRTALQGRDHGLQSNYHTGANEEGRGRATNTVRWDSADFNGVQLGAHYTLDSDETDGEDDNPFGVGASYSNGGILAFADYVTNDGSVTTPNGDLSSWKVGGKYSMDNIAVMGQYEDGEANATDITTWHIGGSYTMGNNMVYAAYGNAESETGAVTNSDVDAWTIALMHSMSKRTKAYVGYNQQEDDVVGGIDRDEFTLGLKHKF
jgi:predicted porin